MKQVRWAMCLCLFIAGAANAQDDRKITSPDGQIEFHLFTSVPEGSILNCLAYQIWWRGKLLIDTSYLGLNIHFQEPLLGENVGLSADHKLPGEHYNGLFADYLQTSTTGRRIQIEIRVWNDGIAFRYIVPRSPLLVDLLIEDDATEYRFSEDATTARPERTALPYTEQEASGAWISVNQQSPAQLIRINPRALATHLPDKPSDPHVAIETKTPWTSPWHTIAIAPNHNGIDHPAFATELSNQ